MSVLSIVKGCPLFFDLYDNEIMTICEHCKVLTLKPDDFVFQHGDVGEELYLILNGTAKVFNVDNKEIARIKKGDLFGEMVLLKENVRYGTVKSDNFTDVLVMNYSDIFGLYKSNPRIFSLLILNLSRLLAGRLQGAGKRISNLITEMESIKQP